MTPISGTFDSVEKHLAAEEAAKKKDTTEKKAETQSDPFIENWKSHYEVKTEIPEGSIVGEKIEKGVFRDEDENNYMVVINKALASQDASRRFLEQGYHVAGEGEKNITLVKSKHGQAGPFGNMGEEMEDSGNVFDRAA
ncbi:MAG TPA: hypothetical protein VF817_01480 [Patescibacteria group bacterium]